MRLSTTTLARRCKALQARALGALALGLLAGGQVGGVELQPAAPPEPSVVREGGWGEGSAPREAEPSSASRLEDQANQPCPSPEQRDKWFQRIDSIKADISLGQRRVPQDCSSHLFTSTASGQSARHGSVTNHHWVAPELWHQPLYFEDVPLEQNGQTKHPVLQPSISMARFYLTIPAMPYKMLVDPPFSCVAEYGKYRPGSCAPCILQLPPKP